MSQKHSRKPSSTHGRTSTKPSLQRRIPPSSTHIQALSIRPALSRKVTTTPDTHEESDAMCLAGLPQFCTTCDKQIVTPGNSVLYCSEACRKRDAVSTTPLEPPLSPLFTNRSIASYFDAPEVDILPPCSPTVLRPASMDFYFGQAPREPTPSVTESDVSDDVPSEAVRFLSQFHSHSYSGERLRPRRPRSSRHSTMIDGLPSLIHTPSSSIGTAASVDRSLPRRHDVLTSQNLSKSVALVLPSWSSHPTSAPDPPVTKGSVDSTSSTGTAFRVPTEEKGSYGRRQLSGFESPGSGGGLRDLFGARNVQAAHGGGESEAVHLHNASESFRL